MGFVFKLFKIVFVIFLFVVNLSSSSPTANDDQLSLLTVRFDGLQVKMDQLVIELEEEKTLRSNLQAMNKELSNESKKQRSEIEFLMAENIKQEKEIHLLKNKLITDSNNNDKQQNIQPFKKMSVDLSPRLPPSSCRQLSTIGHYLDGIYLVANQDTNKVESVYCDFGSGAISETLFGNVEVKSKSVNFYVQRNSGFDDANNVVIPFNVERLNVGGAMNTAAGVFTAPVDGIYHFEFSATRDGEDSDPVYVFLLVNGERIGISFGSNIPGYYVGASSINAHLRLKTWDQVSLLQQAGTIYDDNSHYTHFSGWLVEEDLVLV